MATTASWYIPRIDEEALEINLVPGSVLTLLGPNGSGKSSLIYWLSKNATGSSGMPIRRIVAHRRIWMESAGPRMIQSDPDIGKRLLSNHDQKPESRTSGQHEDIRTAQLFQDLMGMETERSFRYTELSEAGKSTGSLPASVLRKISDLMTHAGLELKFSINRDLEFEVQRGSASYPISEMSDGEKAAFLLAAEVLLAPENSILLLDEPERHLHRAISANIISTLIAARPDCIYIVATHDLELVLAFPPASLEAISVRNVELTGDATPGAWSIQNLAMDMPLSESVRRALLGGRRDLLFVEGDSSSLDYKILSELFSDWTVYPLGSYEKVQQAVKGLTRIDQFHWNNAKGIIDGDARTEEEIGVLYERSILVLPVNEIENLYYLPWIVEAQAQETAKHTGRSAVELHEAALESGLGEFGRSGIAENLAATNAEKLLRRKALASLPSKNQLKEAPKEFQITLQSSYEAELSNFRDYLERRDIEAIVTNYSIRDSGYRAVVSKALGYPNADTYQSAVLETLKRKPELLVKLQKFVGSLPAAGDTSSACAHATDVLAH